MMDEAGVSAQHADEGEVHAMVGDGLVLEGQEEDARAFERVKREKTELIWTQLKERGPVCIDLDDDDE